MHASQPTSEATSVGSHRKETYNSSTPGGAVVGSAGSTMAQIGPVSHASPVMTAHTTVPAISPQNSPTRESALSEPIKREGTRPISPSPLGYTQGQSATTSVPTISPRSGPPAKGIDLNVGGVFYSTSLKTLFRFPDSKIPKMFNDGMLLIHDGKFLIDRDGELFRYILNYLRDGEVVLPTDQHTLKRLLKEANFFGLTLLSAEISNLLIVDAKNPLVVSVQKSFANGRYSCTSTDGRYTSEKQDHWPDFNQIVSEYLSRGYRLQDYHEEVQNKMQFRREYWLFTKQ